MTYYLLRSHVEIDRSLWLGVPKLTFIKPSTTLSEVLRQQRLRSRSWTSGVPSDTLPFCFSLGPLVPIRNLPIQSCVLLLDVGLPQKVMEIYHYPPKHPR